MAPLLGPALRSRIPAQPPRPVELLEGLRLSRAFSWRSLGGPIAILGLVALLPLIALLADTDAILQLRESELAQGRVESVGETRACNERGVLVHYVFTAPGGVELRGRKALCARSPYAGVHEGDPVPVRFLVADPAVHGIAGAQDPAPLLLFLSLPLLGLLLLVPLTWPQLAPVFRDRKLFRTGVLATGRVTFVKKQNDGAWSGFPMLTRATVFVAVAGEEHRATCTNDWLLAHLPPGAEVTICHARGRAMLVENYLR